MNVAESLRFFIPEIFLLTGAFAAVFVDLFSKNKKAAGVLSLLVLIGTACLSKHPEGSNFLFFGLFLLDSWTHFFRLLALGIVGVTILSSLAYKALPSNDEGEFYSLFLFMAFGLILMAASTNLLMIFLSIEFVSLLSYLLTGFLKKDSRAKEAAIKYLLFGSLASGVMLYGMSLLYGATGSLELSAIQAGISHSSFNTLSLIALLFFITGLGFKISAAPFHFWAPDVYEAAPTSVTAFLTVGPKALGFAVMIRVLSVGFPWLAWKWKPLFALLSILTMTIGNVTAISQNNIKRLLAYSSIAQAGYILMGIAAANETGLKGVLIYLMAYAFTNLGAFTAVIIASNHFGNDELESYAGLAKRSPFLAASLTLFLLSLAGLPPTAGFIGKFYVFSSAIQEKLFALAVIAAVNSAVAAFYYFKIVRIMYLVPETDRSPIAHPFPLKLALVLMLTGVLLMGLIPSPFIAFVKGIFS